MNQSSPQPDDVWVGLAKAEVNEGADPKEHLQGQQQQHDIRIIHVRGIHHELATTVVEVQSITTLPMSILSSYSESLLVHPILWEFLTLSSKNIEPSPVPSCNSWFEALPMQRYPVDPKEPVPCDQTTATAEDSEAILNVTVQVLYHESPGSSGDVTASTVQESLLGRCIRANSTLLLAPHNVLIVIHRIVVQDSENGDGVLRVANNTSYIDVELLQPTASSQTSLTNLSPLLPINVPDYDSCPGYENLLLKLVRLLSLEKYRPTGILLVGGAGVGKTRMAACIARQWNEGSICWWSLTSEQQATPDVVAPNTSLYVVDGLHCLKSDNELDKQKLASIAVVLDRCTALGIPVLATGRVSHVEPLTKAGRLEIAMEMHAPDQHQRETILSEWLPQWGKGLAQLTAGCVAADLLPLQQAAVDAMSWKQLTAVANAIVPSQLAALDVQKPQRMLLSTNPKDWAHHHSLCFTNLAGYDSIKRQLYRTVVLPWRRRVLDDPSSEQHHGIAPPTGVLFHGPSGCGKTMAAQCLASSLGLPMIHVRAATEVLSPWVGGSEELVQSLFAKARYAAPCILFLDEIDSIASNRDDTGSGGVMSRVLSTLLNEMDGVTTTTSRSQVLVMACSNRKESLDTALLRPGRLEEHILLAVPSSEDVRAILIHCLRKTPHETTELDRVVDRLVTLEATGADVYGLCREAVLQALRNGADRVATEDFDSAFLF